MCIYPQHWGFPALTEPSASPAASLGIFEVRRGEKSYCMVKFWLAVFLMSVWAWREGSGDWCTFYFSVAFSDKIPHAER